MTKQEQEHLAAVEMERDEALVTAEGWRLATAAWQERSARLLSEFGRQRQPGLLGDRSARVAIDSLLSELAALRKEENEQLQADRDKWRTRAHAENEKTMKAIRETLEAEKRIATLEAALRKRQEEYPHADYCAGFPRNNYAHCDCDARLFSEALAANAPCACHGDTLCPEHSAEVAKILSEPPREIPALRDALANAPAPAEQKCEACGGWGCVYRSIGGVEMKNVPLLCTACNGTGKRGGK